MTTAVRLADDAAGLMYSADDQAGITSDLAKIGAEGYQQRLTEIGQRVGLAPGSLEPAVEQAIAERAARNGASIVATHNNDLSGFMERNPDATPADLQAWEANRSEWKSRQIAFNETMQNRAAADQDFIDRNDISADVMMWVSPEDAICQECQDLVDLGEMTQDEASGIDLPAHINCQHGWEYSDNLGDQVTTRADVWLGRWTDEEDGPTWTIEPPPAGMPPASELPGGGARTGEDITGVREVTWQRQIDDRFADTAQTGVVPPLPGNWDTLSPRFQALWNDAQARALATYQVEHPAPPGAPGGAIPRDKPLQPGTVLTASYKGQDYRLEVRQGPDGTIVYQLVDPTTGGGPTFKSLSAAGHEVTGTSVNGWKFWSIDSTPAAPTPPPTPPITSEGATTIDRSKPLESGQRLVASYKGEDFTLEVRTGADGSLVYATGGVEYSSLSAAARGVTGNSVNGWAFWKVPAGAVPPGGGVVEPIPGTTGPTGPSFRPGGITPWRWEEIAKLGPLPAPKTWYDLTPDEQAVWARYHPQGAVDGKPANIASAEQQAKALGHDPTVADWKRAAPETQYAWQREYPNIPPDQAAWVDVTGHGQFKAPDGTDQPTTWRYMTTREQTEWLANHTPSDWRYSTARDGQWIAGEAPTPQERPDLLRMQDLDAAARPMKRTAKDEIERAVGDLRAKYSEIFNTYDMSLSSINPADSKPYPVGSDAYAWNYHEEGRIEFNSERTSNPSLWEFDLRKDATHLNRDSHLPFHPPGNVTLEATTAHEFGHSVQDFLDTKLQSLNREAYRVYHDYETHQAVTPVTISHYGISGRQPAKERFAESFADAWMRTEHPDQRAYDIKTAKNVHISDIPPSPDEIATAEMLNKVFAILRKDPTLAEPDREALGRLFPSSFR